MGIGKGQRRIEGWSFLCVSGILPLCDSLSGISSVAAATEAAFCGILKVCGQLQSAALAAATHGIFTLVCEFSILAAAASVGILALMVRFQFLVDILGSRFASVQVEATPRVDVDETPLCFISPQSGVDITSLKTSSFQVFVSVPGRPTAVARVSEFVSLKEVALGLELEEWVDDGLIYAMVGSRARDLRVHVGSTGLVRDSTLQFCIQDSLS